MISHACLSTELISCDITFTYTALRFMYLCDGWWEKKKLAIGISYS